LRAIKEALLTSFEVVAFGVMLLLLPSVVAGLIFDWILIEIFSQVMLVAVGGTAVLSAIAIYEGWYLDHLSDWVPTRSGTEPTLGAESGTAQSAQRDPARSV
jgi:hypothetical protein